MNPRDNIPFHVHLEKSKGGIDFYKPKGCKKLWGLRGLSSYR